MVYGLTVDETVFDDICSDSDTNVETLAISLNNSLRCESAPAQSRPEKKVRPKVPRQKSHDIPSSRIQVILI